MLGGVAWVQVVGIADAVAVLVVVQCITHAVVVKVGRRAVGVHRVAVAQKFLVVVDAVAVGFLVERIADAVGVHVGREAVGVERVAAAEPFFFVGHAVAVVIGGNRIARAIAVAVDRLQGVHQGVRAAGLLIEVAPAVVVVVEVLHQRRRRGGGADDHVRHPVTVGVGVRRGIEGEGVGDVDRSVVVIVVVEIVAPLVAIVVGRR